MYVFVALLALIFTTGLAGAELRFEELVSAGATAVEFDATTLSMAPASELRFTSLSSEAETLAINNENKATINKILNKFLNEFIIYLLIISIFETNINIYRNKHQIFNFIEKIYETDNLFIEHTKQTFLEIQIAE